MKPFFSMNNIVIFSSKHKQGDCGQMLDKHRFGQFPLLDDRKGKNCLLNSTQPLIKPMSQNNKRKKCQKSLILMIIQMPFIIHLFQNKKLLYQIFWQLQKTNHGRLRDIWELSVLSVQFSCKPKIYGRAWVWTKGGENRCATG